MSANLTVSREGSSEAFLEGSQWPSVNERHAQTEPTSIGARVNSVAQRLVAYVNGIAYVKQRAWNWLKDNPGNIVRGIFLLGAYVAVWIFCWPVAVVVTFLFIIACVGKWMEYSY